MDSSTQICGPIEEILWLDEFFKLLFKKEWTLAFHIEKWPTFGSIINGIKDNRKFAQLIVLELKYAKWTLERILSFSGYYLVL